MTSTSQIIRCPSCGAANRVSEERIAGGLSPVCGRCKASLSEKPGVRVVTDQNYAEQVEQSPLPVLLDLWAPWCGPCRMVAPTLEKLAGEMAGRVRFAKLNVDENPGINARFGVRSIPTLLILQNGREVDRLVGVQPAQEIANRLSRFL